MESLIQDAFTIVFSTKKMMLDVRLGAFKFLPPA